MKNLKYQEQYNKDYEKEKQYSRYLLNELLPKVNAIGTRVEDYETQISGIDTILQYNGKKYFCDEKYQQYWINPPSSCIELRITNKQGNTSDGWFYYSGATAYMFVYFLDTTIDGCKRTEEPVTYNDINGIECILVTKDAIKKYMAEQGYKEEDLEKHINEANELAKNDKYHKKAEFQIGKMYFTYFPYKYEQAYNIRIPRSELEKIADDFFIYGIHKNKNKKTIPF